MLRIMSGTLAPPSMRHRNSRRPVRRKVCVSIRVIEWRAAIALSCASDTLGGTSRMTSFGTKGAPSGGRLNPLRATGEVLPPPLLLLPLPAPLPPPAGGGRLTGVTGGGSPAPPPDGSCGSPRSGVGNSREAIKAPSASPATPPTTYQTVFRFESPPDVGGGLLGGHANVQGLCADAPRTWSVTAKTIARRIRKIVRVIN